MYAVYKHIYSNNCNSNYVLGRREFICFMCEFVFGMSVCVFVNHSIGEKFYVSTQLDNLIPKFIYKEDIKEQDNSVKIYIKWRK